MLRQQGCAQVEHQSVDRHLEHKIDHVSQIPDQCVCFIYVEPLAQPVLSKLSSN